MKVSRAGMVPESSESILYMAFCKNNHGHEDSLEYSS